MADVNRERAKGVREAWKNERALVMEGKGTRQWSQREQISLIRKNQVRGIDGHHMKSVKTHPQYAANPNNIQFLKKGNEHIMGAHGGNTKNATNGYYNPETKTMHRFGNRDPQAPQVNLNTPLSQKQMSSAIKREQSFQNRVSRDRAYANQWRKSNGYAPMFPEKTKTQSKQVASNKGIESMKSKSVNSSQSISKHSFQGSINKGITSAKQKAASKPLSEQTKSTNQGIKSYQSKASGQTTAISKSATSGAAKGSANSSGGKSSGSSQSK